MPMVKVQCHGCGAEFHKYHSQIKNSKNVYCSQDCYFSYLEREGRFRNLSEDGVKARQENLQGKVLPCAECGKEVYKHPYLLKKFKNVYCSKPCSISHRIKRQKEKANHETCNQCGKMFRRGPARDRYNNGIHFCSKKCLYLGRSGEGHHNWKGGRQQRDDGYVDLAPSLVPEAYKSMIRKDRRVMEHRLVMAMHLGRPLTADEIVHHKNTIRHDNRVENLELHSAPIHDAITQSENKKIRDLQAQIKKLQTQLDKLT